MRLAFLTLSVLLGSVAALPITTPYLARRDTSVIDRYLARMSSDLQVLKSSLNALPKGGSQEVANQKALTLLEQLKSLGRTMETGTTAVRSGPSVLALETLGLTTRATSMSNLINDVTTGFNSENTKKMIWFAGKREAQYQFADQLSRNSRANRNFATALIERLPMLEQGLAGVLKTALGALVEPAVQVSLSSPT
jgi:hypothetical protein